MMKLDINIGPYASPKGSFRLLELGPSHSPAWHGCREIFHNHNATKSSSPWLVKIKDRENVIKFIQEVESRLGLEERSDLQLTDKDGVFYIKPCSWWYAQKIRLSLLTALIRCGVAYKGSNFAEALYSTRYTKTTKEAVEKLFAGYTNYVGKGHMWVSALGGKNAAGKVRFLIREKDEIKASKDALEEAKAIVSATTDKKLLALLVANSLDTWAGRAKVENESHVDY
jgi:hypothetical protein